MDTMQLIVYLVASFLAIRSLSSLMTHHRQHYLLTRIQQVTEQVDAAALAEKTARLKAQEARDEQSEQEEPAVRAA